MRGATRDFTNYPALAKTDLIPGNRMHYSDYHFIVTLVNFAS